MPDFEIALNDIIAQEAQEERVIPEPPIDPLDAALPPELPLSPEPVLSPKLNTPAPLENKPVDWPAWPKQD